MTAAPAMNPLAFLAYYQGTSWSDWIAHRTVSAIIHVVIYGFVFKLMRQISTGEAPALELCYLGTVPDEGPHRHARPGSVQHRRARERRTSQRWLPEPPGYFCFGMW